MLITELLVAELAEWTPYADFLVAVNCKNHRKGYIRQVHTWLRLWPEGRLATPTLQSKQKNSGEKEEQNEPVSVQWENRHNSVDF